jgi:hypothetical protein
MKRVAYPLNIRLGNAPADLASIEDYPHLKSVALRPSTCGGRDREGRYRNRIAQSRQYAAYFYATSIPLARMFRFVWLSLTASERPGAAAVQSTSP